MPFKPGKTSTRNLQGVEPGLVAVVMRAYELSSVDFSVTEGLRTMQRQESLVAAGRSKTLDSRHLADADTGFGNAVDLVPYLRGRPRWKGAGVPEAFQEIRRAMFTAAAEYGYILRWGGDFRMQGRRDGWDKPHFEHPIAAYWSAATSAAKRQLTA